MVAYPVQVGDVFTMGTPEGAFESMILLHDNGIETCLHSCWNGAEYALEIIYIPAEQE